MAQKNVKDDVRKGATRKKINCNKKPTEGLNGKGGEKAKKDGGNAMGDGGMTGSRSGKGGRAATPMELPVQISSE